MAPIIVFGTYFVGMFIMMVVARCLNAKPQPRGSFADILLSPNDKSKADSFVVMMWPLFIFVASVVGGYKLLELAATKVANIICPNKKIP